MDRNEPAARSKRAKRWTFRPKTTIYAVSDGMLLFSLLPCSCSNW